MNRFCIFLFIVMCKSFAQEVHSPENSSIIKEEGQFSKKTHTKIMKDTWFSQDKYLHSSTCAAISGFAYHFYVCRLEKEEKAGKFFSVSVTALIGIGKEIYDKKKKGHFSWKDLFWDGVGLAVGYLLFIH